MVTVYKYYMLPCDKPTIEMPRGANPLHVGVQNGDIFVWAEVDTNQPLSTFHFRIYGTGHPIEEEGLSYVGTVFYDSLVFHIYEVWDDQRYEEMWQMDEEIVNSLPAEHSEDETQG